MSEETSSWIVLTGNPVDGITFWGPFQTGEYANDWAQFHCRGTDWWITEVNSPQSMDN